MQTREEYEKLSGFIKFCDVIEIDQKYKVHQFGHIIEENSLLKEFISEEILTLKPNETKKYISYAFRSSFPVLFFLNSNYIVKLTITGIFEVFDHDLNALISYAPTKELDHNEIASLKSKHIYHYRYLKDEQLKINLAPRIKIVLKKKSNDNNKIFLDMPAGKAISSLEFKKDTVLVKFKGSHYSKMILDYDLNIKEIEFHGLVKKDLQINSTLKNIKDYRSFLDKLTDNFELYKLMNDSKFKIKITEKDFNYHLDIIKKVINHKDKIHNLINTVNNEFIKIKPNTYFTQILSDMFRYSDGNAVCMSNNNTIPKPEAYNLMNDYNFDPRVNSDYIHGDYRPIEILLELKKKNIDPIDDDTIKRLIKLDKLADSMNDFFEQ